MRLDFLFTYWTLAWFILYVAACFPFPIPNPCLALCGEAVVMSTMLAVFVATGRTRTQTVLLFVGMNLLTKGLPIYLVWDTPWEPDDAGFPVVLFSVYCLYLWAHGTNPVRVYAAVWAAVRNNTYRPFLLRYV
jgi:hypothetical protein